MPVKKKRINYYPFGLKHKGYNNIINPNGNSAAQKFGFGGKEIQDDNIRGAQLNWHDFGARNYDASLGRWFNVDPLAEVMYDQSPYNYAFNNPILFIDPDGRFPIYFHVRSFAPFKKFGFGLWKGDNRGFTRNPNASSRLNQVSHFETNTGASHNRFIGAFSSSSYGAYAYSEAEGSPEYSSNNNISTHMYGNNDALIPGGIDFGGPTHDIDLHTNLDVEVSDLENGNQLLSISGEISGDTFPNAEAIVSDADGNSIWLGSFATKSGPNKGPFITLAGDKNKSMVNINASIITNSKGIFTGVREGGKTISLDDWNKDSSGPMSAKEFNKNYKNLYDRLFNKQEDR